MKKMHKSFLLILSSACLMSCGTQSNSSEIASSELPNSSDTSLPGTSDSIVSPTEWTASDLTSMASFLGEGVTLPFPVGISSKYIDGSGTDQDGICFIVYDASCGDLTSSYGNLLLADGFETVESVEDGLFFYVKENIDESNDLWVQTDYDEEVFEIYAWLEASTPTYETFPYEAINDFFSLSFDETTLPSFELAKGELYDGYGSDDGTYFYVGGYFDENTSDDDYLLDYAVKLEEKGYTVDLDNGAATNNALSFKVEFMASEGYFLLQLSKWNKPQPGDYSLTIEDSAFANKYADDDSILELSGLTFKFTSIMSIDDYFQFSSTKKRSGGELYNVDSLGKIASIIVTANSTLYYATLTLYVSNAPITSTNPGTSVIPTNDGNVFTYNVLTEASYFKLINEDATYASKNNAIVLNYSIK